MLYGTVDSVMFLSAPAVFLVARPVLLALWALTGFVIITHLAGNNLFLEGAAWAVYYLASCATPYLIVKLWLRWRTKKVR